MIDTVAAAAGRMHLCVPQQVRCGCLSLDQLRSSSAILVSLS